MGNSQFKYILKRILFKGKTPLQHFFKINSKGYLNFLAF